MRTKAQLVDEILSIEAIDTRTNLMKKNLAQLESILSDLEDKLVSTTDEDRNDSTDDSTAPKEDLEALRERMKAEMLEDLKEQARKEIEAEVSEAVEDVPAPRTKKQIDRNQMVPIMNITSGTLIYESRKTGTSLELSEYGDIEYIDYQELITMKAAHRRFFDEPFILVMDDDVVEALGLTKMYSTMKNPDQIDTVFDLTQREFENIVEKSPKGIKHLIASRAKVLYETDQLDSVKKINYLNDRFQTDIGKRG